MIIPRLRKRKEEKPREGLPAQPRSHQRRAQVQRLSLQPLVAPAPASRARSSLMRTAAVMGARINLVTRMEVMLI